MAISRRNFIIGAGSGVAGLAIGAGLGAGFMSGRGWQIKSAVPRALPVETLTELPAEADVVVIGGGIAGISTAC